MKIKLVFSFILFVFLFSNLFVTAQALAPNVQWQRTYTGKPWNYINTLVETADSGFIMACSSTADNLALGSGKGGIDIWIVKTDAKGNILWQKPYGGSKKDQVVRIIKGINGGYIFTGLTYSSDGDLTAHHYHGNGDGWIVRIDDTGKILWQNVLGGSGYDYFNNVIITPDNGYLLVGATGSKNGTITQNAGKADVWLVKLDTVGNIIWNKTFGGAKKDIGTNVINTSDGNFLVNCNTYSVDGNVTSNHGGGDAWLIKIDNFGNLIWQKSIGGSKFDYINSVVETADKGFIACGNTSSKDGDIDWNSGRADFWIIKVNEDGELQWQKTYGGDKNDRAFTIAVAKDSDFIVSGTTNSNNDDVTQNNGGLDCWVIKINKTGDMLWQKTYGGTGNDSCIFILNTLDGGFAFNGSSTSLGGDAPTNKNANAAGWLVKLKPEEYLLPFTDQAQLLPNAEIKVYPTITNGLVNVILPERLENAKITILNADGKKVDFEEENKGIKRRLLLKNFASGEYIINVATSKVEGAFKIVLVK